MMYDRIVLRYGDLTMKGRNRKIFEDKMLKSVKRAMKEFPEVTYWRTYGRLYVILNGIPHQPVIERLKDLFGIISVSPVISVPSELEAIKAAADEVMKSLDKTPATFKINARRAWKRFAHGSHEMNHLIGSHILPQYPDMKVDVHNPELELKIEIQEEATYLYWENIAAAGGFPYGSNGKAMLLLSGGIDSPVAGWMALRKGLEIEAVHFHSYPFTSQQATDKVITLARRLSYYSGVPIRLHLVPFTEIQTRITHSNQENLTITLMRRAMLRITEQLALKFKAGGIVTGESLGQVASQTLSSMNVIGRATVLPMIKPVIMMDKQEIITIARQIGTFETSILPFEDCCTLFLPKSPSTNPNLRIVERVEQQLPDLNDLIKQAVEGTESVLLNMTEGHHEHGQVDKSEEDWF
ncbi:tRNA uracil 4-sulfurtransferase ThiI [Paenibacillus endoradicis]|uniref:tRNA uracil 4-sulfurtransferase ThiI n=1 Tax=Paenibacillus endoradicis TaxID=2972487 RepID=UPI002159153A|nr:tRNA uracil 4-sulfurtransferase ThiI [Paenibacillus endoradicis]MCR8655975.1 tRNA 4-thiouridine(8) synthase ThiI [Paenibacillus endoradicis]MCR8658301.1 tRNA 4-thiouridine(8) synthase ThiI [Paenibacillus endoradicis]